MSEELTPEVVNTSIILESKVNERVEREVQRHISRYLEKSIAAEVNKAFAAYKDAMMLEISITIGKIMRNTEGENRKPLWESTPEEFGLTHKDLNSHMLGKREEDHAIHKQT